MKELPKQLKLVVGAESTEEDTRFELVLHYVEVQELEEGKHSAYYATAADVTPGYEVWIPID